MFAGAVQLVGCPIGFFSDSTNVYADVFMTCKDFVKNENECRFIKMKAFSRLCSIFEVIKLSRSIKFDWV